MRTNIWYTFRRHAIEIPYPIQVEYSREEKSPRSAERLQALAGRLGAIDLFSGLDDIERLNGLPTRSGKLLLKTALTRLARHYGYLPPEHGDAEIARRIAGWMAEDSAVTLETWREQG